MKKIIKSVVTAATEEPNEGVMSAIGVLKDDFDYIVAGLEKLARSGANASQQAAAIIENISADLKKYTSDVADSVSE